jgi:hypothetical protein
MLMQPDDPPLRERGWQHLAIWTERAGEATRLEEKSKKTHNHLVLQLTVAVVGSALKPFLWPDRQH